MSLIKIANVLLEGTEQFFKVPSLYLRADAPVAPVEGADGAWELRGPGRFDFSTYFNALSVAKWREYTVAERFALHLELAGAACTVTPTRGDSYSVEPVLVEEGAVEVAASGAWQAVDIPLDPDAADIVAGFVIEAQGPVRIRRSAYYAEVDDALVRPVELALATTTFRREDYIRKNVALLRERILESDEDAAQHFSIHVVDNGRTLSESDVAAGPRVHLHPNPNVGGSGGFARGMICALHQDPPATHVLLMDDDVSVSPESVLRAYALLRLVRDEYAEAFVAGAMMERENPAFLFEQGGYWMYNGSSTSLRPRASMEPFAAVVEGECWHTKPQVRGFEDQTQTYAAWWFCAIPLSVVRAEGLPLPIFVRFDDMEYALRCKRPIMTMNGICVWHDAFAWRYSYVQERYQSIRNALIVQATTGVGRLSDIVGPVAGLFFHRDICLFNYGAAELVLEAFEDFMAGPEVTLAPGFGEKRFLGLNRAGEKLRPLDEVATELRERYAIELPAMTTFELDSDVTWTPEEASWFDRTKNGQLALPAPEPPRVTGVRSAIARAKFKPSDPAVPAAPQGMVEEGALLSMGRSADGALRWAAIDWRGGVQQFAKAYDCDLLVALSPTAHTGAIRVRDAERARDLVARYEADLRALDERREELRAAYATVRDQVTSEAWWLDYLQKCAM